MDLVSRQDVVSFARHLHRAEFLHASQQMSGQAQTRAGTAVRAPGPVFGALVSAGGHVPWSPWCWRPQRLPGSRLAGRSGRHFGPALPCRMGRLRLQQHSLSAGAWLCLLPPRCLGKADGEPLLQAVLQSWDSPILQKAAFCLLDGSKDDGSLDGWRPRESLGTLLHWGVDGLCRGGNRATQQLPPLFLLPGSLVPSSPQLPHGVLRVWLSASHLVP